MSSFAGGTNDLEMQNKSRLARNLPGVFRGLDLHLDCPPPTLCGFSNSRSVPMAWLASCWSLLSAPLSCTCLFLTQWGGDSFLFCLCSIDLVYQRLNSPCFAPCRGGNLSECVIFQKVKLIVSSSSAGPVILPLVPGRNCSRASLTLVEWRLSESCTQKSKRHRGEWRSVALWSWSKPWATLDISSHFLTV